MFKYTDSTTNNVSLKKPSKVYLYHKQLLHNHDIEATANQVHCIINYMRQ